MSKEYPNTFAPWLKEKCGEVRYVPIESMGANYQSPYLVKYNYLMERGWYREDKMWVCPDPPNNRYSNIEYAFSAQRYMENIKE